MSYRALDFAILFLLYLCIHSHYSSGGGPFGCVGKIIALQELRIVIATTVLSFDLAFAPGVTIASFVRGALDRFIIDFTAPLQVVLTKREAATVHIPEGPGN